MVESFTNDFLRATLDKIELVTLEYVILVVDALHTVVMKVSHEGGRLLIRDIAFKSSSIVVLALKFVSLGFCTH